MHTTYWFLLLWTNEVRSCGIAIYSIHTTPSSVDSDTCKFRLKCRLYEGKRLNCQDFTADYIDVSWLWKIRLTLRILCRVRSTCQDFKEACLVVRIYNHRLHSPSLPSSGHQPMERWLPRRWRCHPRQPCYEWAVMNCRSISYERQERGFKKFVSPGFLGRRLTSILPSFPLVVSCTVGMRHNLHKNTHEENIFPLIIGWGANNVGDRLTSMMSSSCTSIASSLLSPLVAFTWTFHHF